MAKSRKVRTPVFRVSYPTVFKSKFNNMSKKDEYSVVALFPKDADLSSLYNVVNEVLEETWGKDKTKWPKTLRLPFRDQDEKMKDGMMPPGHEAGAKYLNLRSVRKPGIVAADADPITLKARVITDEAEFYPGCYAMASMSVYSYAKGGNCGVNFGLMNIQKVKDGEALGGRPRPESEFAPIEGAELAATDLFA